MRKRKESKTRIPYVGKYATRTDDGAIRLTDEGRDFLAAFVRQWPNPLAAMYRTCAKQYGAMRKVGISNDEMMSLAFTGWLRAVAAYDPGRGSFMTLATFWARSTERRRKP
jgi:hypothetical protein